ncbi:MAG: sugar transferase [Nitrospirae bacterium]|nr:sugar transferase [Nitrospirota bacterium]
MAAKRRLTTGYQAISGTVSFLFDVPLAIILLILASPLMLIIAIAVKLTDGGPVFYRGDRLGKDKKIFTMYKFRTLIPDAERIIGAELLTSQHNIVTKVGRCLRETRLDELPQLYNILKRDMTFMGPRPERVAIYKKFCQGIRGYDMRFTVPPGLIGYSQLFTPHSTPKRMRTLIDNMYIHRKQNIFVDHILVVYTAYLALKHVPTKVVFRASHDLAMRLIGRGGNKRFHERVHHQDARAYYGHKNHLTQVNTLVNNKDNAAHMNDRQMKVYFGSDGQFAGEGLLINVNEDAFLMFTDKQVKDADYFKLEIVAKNKKKTAYCDGVIYKEYASGNNDYQYAYVYNYTPASPLNSYIIHQYFLHKSVAEV